MRGKKAQKDGRSCSECPRCATNLSGDGFRRDCHGGQSHDGAVGGSVLRPFAHAWPQGALWQAPFSLAHPQGPLMLSRPGDAMWDSAAPGWLCMVAPVTGGQRRGLQRESGTCHLGALACHGLGLSLPYTAASCRCRSRHKSGAELLKGRTANQLLDAWECSPIGIQIANIRHTARPAWLLQPSPNSCIRPGLTQSSHTREYLLSIK